MEKKEEDQELPEYLELHQMVVRKIGEICRIVNQVAAAALNTLRHSVFFLFYDKCFRKSIQI